MGIRILLLYIFTGIAIYLGLFAITPNSSYFLIKAICLWLYVCGIVISLTIYRNITIEISNNIKPLLDQLKLLNSREKPKPPTQTIFTEGEDHCQFGEPSIGLCFERAIHADPVEQAKYLIGLIERKERDLLRTIENARISHAHAEERIWQSLNPAQEKLNQIEVEVNNLKDKNVISGWIALVSISFASVLSLWA